MIDKLVAYGLLSSISLAGTTSVAMSSVTEQSFAQYGLVGIVVYFVIKELITLVKWTIDKKKSSSSESISELNAVVSDFYTKIDSGLERVHKRIDDLGKETNEIKIQQSGMPGTLYREFVTEDQCSERRSSCQKK